MPERTDQVWHAYLPELRAGRFLWVLGTGVHGPYAPTEGSAGGCARLELTRGLT